jgi:actin-like ATPase involved in cell morphogenesis
MSKRAIGYDPGTMFCQTAEMDGEKVKFTSTRNAFVELPQSDDVEETLKRNNWQYIKDDGRYYVVGEDCIKVANIFPGKVEVRRPMADGVLNKNEDKKLVILIKIVKLIA